MYIFRFFFDFFFCISEFLIDNSYNQLIKKLISNVENILNELVLGNMKKLSRKLRDLTDFIQETIFLDEKNINLFIDIFHDTLKDYFGDDKYSFVVKTGFERLYHLVIDIMTHRVKYFNLQTMYVGILLFVVWDCTIFG